MGAAHSTIHGLAWKLRFVIPEVNGHDMGVTNDRDRPFTGEKDREQFIHAIITIITQNGTLDLRDYSFRLLYSRRDDDRIVARIVAEKDGVIRAKIEPEADGGDQMEAFRALKRDVETKLEKILSELPADGVGIQDAAVAESSRTARRSTSMAPETQMEPANSGGEADGLLDEPPAYASAMGGKKHSRKCGGL